MAAPGLNRGSSEYVLVFIPISLMSVICVESMDRCAVCGKNSLDYFLLQCISLSSECLNIPSYCASSLF